MAETTSNKSEAKHIDSTIEILDKHVKDESVTGVSNSINAWIKTLSGYAELQSIADDL